MQPPDSLNSALLRAGCLVKNHMYSKVTNNCQILFKKLLLIPVISEVCEEQLNDKVLQVS